MRKYTINNIEYDHDSLLHFCNEQYAHAEEWEKSHFQFLIDWLSGKNEFEVSTSGSTGVPKKIVITRKHMINSAAMTVDYFKLKPGTKAFHCLPSQYISGKMMLVRGIEFGWNLILIQPKGNPIEGIITDGFDFAAMTPMQAALAMESDKDSFCKIKKIILGGAPISLQLEKKLIQCNNEVFATYGMTETVSHVAIRNINGPRAGISYHGLPGVKFSIDKRQCLAIEAPHLGVKKILTNDVVLLTSPVSFQFLGRNDFVINSGGIKIHPEKLEHLLAHIIQYPFFIYPEADELLGEKVVLYMQSDPMTESELLRLRSTMKIYLQSHELPKNVYFCKQFEYTSTDKIIRKKYLLP